MRSVCKSSGKGIVEALDTYRYISTRSTEASDKNILNPQFIQDLHNFYTQYSTTKLVTLTDWRLGVSTVSTEPITTTTIKYKEG